MTKEELKEYKKIKIELITIEDKLTYLREKKTSIKSQIINDMPTSSKSELDRLGELLEEIEKVINLYFNKKKKLLKKLYKIEKSIYVLDELERTVIRYVYFEGKRFEEISCIINYSYRTVRRLHKSAIDKLEVREEI